MRGNRKQGGPGHRVERIAEQIREEVSQIVGYEMSDARIGFATVTDVSVAPDLGNARVFVSILGSPEEKRKGLAALNAAAGYVRRQLAPRLLTKKVPVIHFALDELLEKANRLEDLLKEDDQ